MLVFVSAIMISIVTDAGCSCSFDRDGVLETMTMMIATQVGFYSKEKRQEDDVTHHMVAGRTAGCEIGQVERRRSNCCHTVRLKVDCGQHRQVCIANSTEDNGAKVFKSFTWAVEVDSTVEGSWRYYNTGLLPMAGRRAGGCMRARLAEQPGTSVAEPKRSVMCLYAVVTVSP